VRIQLKSISKSVKMRRTLKCKLEIKDTDKKLLLDTLFIYSQACNYLVNVAIENKIYRRYALHKKAYYSVRQRFNLPSQLTITAIWKVIETLKANKRKSISEFGQHSAIRLNYPRNFSFNYPNISFTSLKGRVKAKVIGAYSNLLNELLNCDWQITESHLCYNRAKDVFYFNLGLKKETPQIQKGINPVGVDLGIKRIAVTSNGKFFDNKKILHTKHRYDYLKSKLQSKGTKSAKRHLKKLSGKIRRFQKDVNHQISKYLVRIIKKIPNGILVFEKLTYIRNTAKVKKRQRCDHSRWAFRELQTFTAYKAEGIGIPVAFVNPRGTSHQCCRCDSTNTKRIGLHFACHTCGLKLDSDLNAARNIASRYCLEAKVVCQPTNRNTRYNGQSFGQAQRTEAQGSYKPCNLLRGS